MINGISICSDIGLCMSSGSRPFERTLSWVEPLTQSRQGFLTGSGCVGPASLGSPTRPCHLMTLWPVAWSIKGTQSIALNKRAKRSLVPLVLYVGMRPPKQSPLRPTKTGRWVHLNQRWKGSLASFAFGYCTGLFWACVTNRVLLVLSWSYLWLCDHKGPVDWASVITKGSLGLARGPADRSILLAFIDHLSMGPPESYPDILPSALIHSYWQHKKFSSIRYSTR